MRPPSPSAVLFSLASLTVTSALAAACGDSPAATVSQADASTAPTADAGGGGPDGAPASEGGPEGGPSADGGEDGASDAETADGADAGPPTSIPLDPNLVSGVYVKGTRLVPRLAVTSEGGEIFLGWHDTKLGFDCDFEPTTSGDECVPRHRPTAYHFPGEPYADAACTTRAFTVPACWTPPYGATFATPQGCTDYSPPEIDRLLTAVTSTYPKSPAGCGAASPVPAGRAAYAIVGPANDLVGRTLGPAAGGAGRIVAGTSYNTDGSTGFAGYYDTTLHSLCTIGNADGTGNTLACLPVAGVGGKVPNEYADPTCSTEAAFVSHYYKCPPPPTPAFLEVGSSSPNGCHSLRSYYGVSQQVSTVYSNPGCAAAKGPVGETFYSVTPVASLASVTPVQEALATRLRPMKVGLSGGAHGVTGWTDATLGTSCAFVRATDGTLRCLPTDGTSQVVDAFLDAKCTQPFVVLELDPCSTQLNHYAQRANPPADACSDPTTTVYTATPTAVTTYYVGAACTGVKSSSAYVGLLVDPTSMILATPK